MDLPQRNWVSSSSVKVEIMQPDNSQFSTMTDEQLTREIYNYVRAGAMKAIKTNRPLEGPACRKY